MIFESAWVRTTDAAMDQSMTALFGTVVNPSEQSVKLTSADCSAVAALTQIHEMVSVNGKSVMREAKGGVDVPAGSHLHLKPGGYHVMLMRLKKKLPVGDEVTCTLSFSTGQQVKVTASVKKFTEEEDHYHSPSPTPSTTR